ncbi:MAG: hypothetical protein FVQ80_18350 [Planctomycetes bacterium]|nr:hypothetical protein [Planctomycetota bacterium]
MNILLTGATGFIGFHIAHELLKDVNCRIIAPIRKANGYKNTAFLSKHGVILKEGLFFKKSCLILSLKSIALTMLYIQQQ